MQNSLQLNQGNLNGSSPAFSNIARWSGVSSTDWSWGGLFADFDNDGWKDLFVTNGIRRDVNNKDFYNQHRAFFNKMENDPEYKNKEEEVKLLSYLEKMPSEKLANYLKVLTLEAQTLARACGKSHIRNLEPEDLNALTLEASAMARVPLAGTDWIPGK